MERVEVINNIRSKILTLKHFLYFNKIKNKDIEVLNNFLTELISFKVDKFTIEVEPGVGGKESLLWSQDIINMYTKYLDNLRAKYQIENNCILVAQKGVFEDFSHETGIHRVQRVPITEKLGRLQTSTASVLVLPYTEEEDISLDDLDIVITDGKGRGPGGQNVNKRNNMIRIKDEITNTQLRVDGRKKIENLAEAKVRILESVKEKFLQEQINIQRDSRDVISNRDRSAKIRTYNYKDNRVQDHRYNISIQELDKVISGRLNLLLDKIKKYKGRLA